jgi:hypothetical protein
MRRAISSIRDTRLSDSLVVTTRPSVIPFPRNRLYNEDQYEAQACATVTYPRDPESRDLLGNA